MFKFFFLTRTKWKRQTAVGLELLAEAGNYAAVQRMLQTSPYWLSQYGNVAASALAAATGNPGGPGGHPGMMNTPTTTPFDIYYRQAAAALQQKHQQSAGASLTPTSEPGSCNTSQGQPGSGQMAAMYVSAGSGGLPPGARFNPLYLSSLPSSMLSGAGAGGPGNGCSPDHNTNSGLLMPLIKMETAKSLASDELKSSKSPSPVVVSQPLKSSPSPPLEQLSNSRPNSNSSSHK